MYQRLKHTLVAGAALSAVWHLSGPSWAAEPIDLKWHEASPEQRLRVEQAVDTYGLFDIYPDKTFRGQRAFTRYELADALARLQAHLNKTYKVPVQVEPRMAAALLAYAEPTGDIPRRHWALQAVLQNLSTGVLQASPRALQFRGLEQVSHQELAFAVYRVLDWLQVFPEAQAKAQAPQDAIDALQALDLLPAESRRNPRAMATRYDLAIVLVNTLRHLEEVAKTRSLVPRVVVPTLPTTPDLQKPQRPDGRRAPVYYLPWRPVASP